MWRILLLPIVALGLWLAPAGADARSGYYVSVHYGYPYWHGGYYRYYPWYYSPFWAYDWPPPVYYAPPPVYYVAPRAPYCVQDEVYRYLPDGRIQWGTRTRCY